MSCFHSVGCTNDEPCFWQWREGFGGEEVRYEFLQKKHEETVFSSAERGGGTPWPWSVAERGRGEP